MNTLFVLPLDSSSVSTFMAPLAGQRALVLTPDVETAVMVASATGRDDVLAATSVARAARVTPPAIVIGPPEIILGLMQRSRLKLDGVTALVLAWVGASPALEAVMVDVPKDAARTIVTTATAAATPDVEALVERYARRPRRVAGTPPIAPVPTARYVTVTEGNRPTTLRRLLDDLDPPSAIIWTRTDESERIVREILRSLGYSGSNAAVQTARDTISESAALVVLYDMPRDAAEMASIIQSAPAQIIALGRLPGATPLTLSGPLNRATQRLEELRRVLEAGVPAAEVTWLQPLLDSYDGIEIAAAAIHLLERERRVVPPPTPGRPERSERSDRPSRKDKPPPSRDVRGKSGSGRR
ncbi:MAG TPA: DEAD/DEAH box helicase [Gemmatimonadaceae bacterium]|nr:DEAD/DEAH box helicase [Gemmatimonadaceae bacterium]